MCGIFSVINNNKKSFDILKYLHCIDNRGPDDLGWVEWRDNKVLYSKEDQIVEGDLIQGHVRLSIIDLSDLGSQPMISLCNQYSISYNGEVYNYIELREELKRNGVHFISDSDTEVVLNALIFWGKNAISKFRGMFAFTFYDSKRNSLLVARDHFGIKPLYYASVNGNLYFASEVKQLLLLDDINQSYHEPQMIYEYLVSGATDHSQDTMYSQIKQFPAAHMSEIDLGNFRNLKSIDLKINKYWDIALDKKINPSFNEAVVKVRDLFLESIKLHMRSDVPVGAALSGGIDSSAIVCGIRHLNPEQEIHSFSYIAANELSEEHWIDIVNNHTNAKAHKIKVSKEELVSDLNDLIKTQGEPFGSTSIYAQYRVFQEAKKNKVTVMLDGQGADEMLGGYTYFQASILASLIIKGRFYKGYRFFNSCIKNTSSTKKYLMLVTIRELLPIKFLSKVKSLFLSNKKILWISKDWIKNNDVDHLKTYKHSLNLKHPLNSHLKSTLTKLGLPHLLRYEDRNSMRWSVESRVPFL